MRVELNGDRLKQHVHTSKAISFNTDGCRLRSKVGKVSFDLSGFKGISQCSVFIKKISGNGKVRISSGANNYNVLAALRSSQEFIVIVDESGIIEISRPNDGTGELSVVGLIVNTEGEDSDVSKKWRSIISKCGKYASIRLVKGRLFATHGGYLEKGFVITNIVTNPPNMYRRDGDKLLFTGSCEITEMSIDPGAQPAPAQNIDVYANRKPPTKTEVSMQTSTPQPGMQHTVISTLKSFAPTDVVNSLYEHVMYDSKSFRGFQANQNKFSKISRSCGKIYLVMKSNATCNFTLATLQPNTEYICIISGKKLNGNGRVHVGLSTEEIFKKGVADIVFPGHFANRYVTLKTDGFTPNKLQRFHAMTPGKYCNGDVLINRIIIIENIGLKVAQAGLHYHEHFPEERPRKVLVSSNYNVAVEDSDDSVFMSSKRYATYFNNQAKEMGAFSVVMSPMTISGTMWFNKIKSVLPKTRRGNKDDNNVLVVGRSGHIKESSFIWIDVFKGDLQPSDIQKLSMAKIIMSPSLSNIDKIKKALPDANVKFGARPMPYIKSSGPTIFLNKKYVVAIDRESVTTKRLLEAWNNDLPKLAIIGGRGHYPDFVTPINEYMPYEELLYVIGNAQCMVDMPTYSDYESSFLSIAHAMNVPIVSTNKSIMYKPNCVFMSNESEGSAIDLPSAKTIVMDVRLAINMPRKVANMDLYNKQFLDSMKNIFI